MRLLPMGLAVVVLLSGCLGSEGPTAESGGGRDNGAQPSDAPTAHAFSQDTYYTWGWCFGTESPDAACGVGGVGATSRMVYVPVNGTATWLDVNLTWEATTSLAEHMLFWAVAGKPCGEGCFQASRYLTEPQAGRSPFRLALAPQLDPDQEILLIMEPACSDPQPVCAHVAIEQTLHVEGTVWTVAKEDATA